MTQTTPQPAAPARRRWFQFRLKWLMLLIAVVSASLAFYFSPTKRAERAVEALQGTGAEVLFDYQRLPDNSTYSHQVEPPGPSAIRQIAGEGFFQDAEWIVLHDTALTADALLPLAQLSSLRRITLTNCVIGDQHMVHFSKLRLIESLDLKSNQITDTGLLQLRGMLRLETISISQNHIRGDGLQHLGGLKRLKQLFLHDNPVADDNLAHIGALTNLEMLGLAGTNVTDDGLKHLANLKKLRYLGLTRTNVTKAAVKTLQSKLPNCEIEH